MKGSFKAAFSGSAIGVQLGLSAFCIASFFSDDKKFFAAAAVSILPIVSGIVVYNRSINEKILDSGYLNYKPAEKKFYLKILAINFK